MRTPDSHAESAARTLLERAAPGARSVLVVLAAIAPLCGAALLAIDIRAHGGVDPAMAAAAALFAGLSAYVGTCAIRRIRGIAAIADAVRTASMPKVTAAELQIAESLGTVAVHWNALTSRIVGEESTTGGGLGAMAGDGEVVDALPEGVLVFDRHGAVLSRNAAAVAMLGGEEQIAPGMAVDAIADGALAGQVRAVQRGGPVQRFEVDIGSSDAPHVLRVRAARFGKNRDRVLVTLSDVTRQAAVDASRGSYLARATHELRAPLTNLKLYTEQAIEEGDDPHLRQEALNVIGREVLRLERTVSDLLRVSELESGALKAAESDIRVDDMLHEVTQSFAATAAEKTVTLKLDASPKLPVLRGDRDHIELVIQNLVGNAIKYTPEGGSVTIRADEDGGEFTLSVVDTGIGIAPDEQPLVFEKFYRSNDARVHDHEGSGLGLALAREIARRHNGDVTLESELNRGSTFTLRLPVGRAA